MTGELVVTSADGAPIIRTSSRAEAEHWAAFLGGRVITEGTAA